MALQTQGNLQSQAPNTLRAALQAMGVERKVFVPKEKLWSPPLEAVVEDHTNFVVKAKTHEDGLSVYAILDGDIMVSFAPGQVKVENLDINADNVVTNFPGRALDIAVVEATRDEPELEGVTSLAGDFVKIIKGVKTLKAYIAG